MSVEYALLGGDRLDPQDIVHTLIPGRGRIENGTEMHPSGLRRVEHTARFFRDHHLLDRGGVIVSSGYKSPADQEGVLQYCPETGREAEGIPEAVLSDRVLDALGIPKESRRLEPDSIDTTTNLANSRDLFPDKRPVGIFAQEGHLDRIVNYIAPRILRQPFVGVVVPELDADNPEKDILLAQLFSHAILLGIHPDTPNLKEVLARRAGRGWKTVLGVSRLVRRNHSYSPGDIRGQA